MTRGGDEDIKGGLRKFLDTRKGGSEKIRGGGRGSENLYTSKPTGEGGGAPIKLNRSWGGGGGLLKFQASTFNIFIPSPSPRHIKGTFPSLQFLTVFFILIDI